MANKRIKDLATTKYKGFMALDDADGTGKMSVGTIFNNFAPEFVPNSTTTVAGQLYMYNGTLYVAKEAYQGLWNATKFSALSINKAIGSHFNVYTGGSLTITDSSVVNSENIELRVGGTSFGTIAANTSSSISFSVGSRIVLLYADPETLTIKAVAWSSAVAEASLFKIAIIDYNVIPTVIFSAIPIRLFGAWQGNTFSDCELISSGHIEFDNTNGKIKIIDSDIEVMTGSEQYSIPKNTSIDYAFSASTKKYILVYDKNTSTLSVRRYYLLGRSRHLEVFIASVVTDGSTNVVDVKSRIKCEIKPEKPIEGFPCRGLFTRGWIELDTDNHTIGVVGNLDVNFGTGYKEIANGSVFSYTDPDSAYRCIIFDTDALQLRVCKYHGNDFATNEYNKYPLVCVFTSDGGITFSMVPVKLNGSFGKNYARGYVKGAPIEFNQPWDYAVRYDFTGVPYRDSMCQYGDYLITAFVPSGQPAVLSIYQISTKTRLDTIPIPSDDLEVPHCNVMCFANDELHSENSIVPLIYLSKWSHSGNKACLVLDLTYENGSYNLSIVQTIIPNISSSILGQGSLNWVVDRDNAKLYAFAYKLSGASTIVEGNEEMIAVFDLPNTSSSVVTLTDADVLDHYTDEVYSVMQDFHYENGKIYMLCGNGTDRWSNKMRVFDTRQKKVVSEIKFTGNSEPEAICSYKGSLIFGFATTPVYTFLFG